MSDELRDQINEIIEADIQLKINDYIEKNGNKGFKGEELKVNIPKSEVDKIIEAILFASNEPVLEDDLKDKIREKNKLKVYL